MDLIDFVDFDSNDIFSYCQDREKLNIKDKANLSDTLKDILEKAKVNDNDDENIEILRKAQKRALLYQSESEIFGRSVREIASGYGKKTVIPFEVEKEEVEEETSQTEEEFKREFNFLRQKPWHGDLALSSFIDSNDYKIDIAEFTKDFYPKFKMAESGESIEDLSLKSNELFKMGDEKFTHFVDRLLAMGEKKEEKKEKKSKKKRISKSIKVKYTRPSGKMFVPDKIDEDAIWGDSLKETYHIDKSFTNDKVEIEREEENIEKEEEKSVKIAPSRPKLEKVKKELLNEVKKEKTPIKEESTDNIEENKNDKKSLENVGVVDKLSNKNKVNENKLNEEKTNKKVKVASKKTKKKKKEKEIIHLSEEEARRRYTMPKGKQIDYNFDEDSIWQGATRKGSYNLNSVLGSSFKDESVLKEKKKEDKDKE